jgi:hypothetical protein
MVCWQKAALNNLQLAWMNSLLAQKAHSASKLAFLPQDLVILVVHADLCETNMKMVIKACRWIGSNASKEENIHSYLQDQ